MHPHRKKIITLLASFGICASSLGYCQTAQSKLSVTPEKGLKSKQAQEPAEFLRVIETSDGQPQALQTALTRYKPADESVIVDLIGAVHIGEGDYYERLNKQFELYDVVLYELVAPKGTRIPKGSKKSSTNPIGFLQKSAQNMLGLQSQLEMIDYQKDNFVHADMSPTEIGEKMEERGDTAFSVGFSALSEMMKNQKGLSKQLGTNSGESIFELMGNPLKMKQMMASQFTQQGALEMGLGSKLNQMLITDRNAAAMQVLKKEIAKGHKKIAIFYGAAHMPDFEKRLERDFGMTRTKQAWLDSWDLTKAPKKKSSGTANMLFNLMKQID